jgi:ABC-type multidrug transport system fused ATPase/permease subunit
MPFTTAGSHMLQFDTERFDLNLQFEQLFLSIIPSTIFILASSWSTLSQRKKRKVVHAPTLLYLKLVRTLLRDSLSTSNITKSATIIYICLALILAVMPAANYVHVSTLSLSAAALRLVVAFLTMALSLVDHTRNPRPSTLLTSYLCLSSLLDGPQVRTMYLASMFQTERVYSGIFLAAVLVKVAVLVLEARQKAKWVRWDDEKEHSPEETSGIFSLSVFLWLNSLFIKGYRSILTVETLLPLDNALDTKTLHEKFTRNMNYATLKDDKFGLAKALARTLTVPLLLPIAPRLALLGFTLCQPFFIEALLDYLAEPTLHANTGYGLIGASFFIYAGIATSMAFTWYFHHRLRIMVRSILVPEVFLKATKARVGATDTNAALTLMSTDLERIRMGFRTLHELWACLIQVAIAAWMLYRLVGVIFLAALGVVLACFICLGVLMNYAGDSQKAWMADVQTRVGLTANVIANMKELKMSGLSAAVTNFVQHLRVQELGAGARYRRIFITAALLGFMPLLLGPPLIFAFARADFNTSRVFTSLSFLTLMTLPLSQVFQAVPEIVSGFACLSRIQAFLSCETRDDCRQVHADQQTYPVLELVVKEGKFGWTANNFVLQDINISLTRGSLTMVIGPVGSGKSTLCRALLGEMPFAMGHLTLNSAHGRVAYCDQQPFLSNGSARDNIVGFSLFDPARYREVIDATALSHDFLMLRHGDATNIGSAGVTLSGGQKQRVALARALYLQADLLIFDDVFSGLDAKTEEHVFSHVFGPLGMLRRRNATVVLSTHSVRHLHSADQVITLENGTAEMKSSIKQMKKPEEAHDDYGHGPLQETNLTQQVQASPAALITPTTPPTQSSNDARQVGDRSVYKYYIKSMGVLLACCSGLFAVLWGAFTNFPTIWLTFWTDDRKAAYQQHSDGYYVGIYGLLQACALVALLLLGIAIFIMSVKRAGANIHHVALTTLIHAPLRFFSNTDIGIVTNLFSQDLNLIDTELPEATINTLVTLTQATGQIVVMLTSSAYLAISYPFLAALLYLVQKFYLRTSRQIRLLDLEAKSPLYTHFLETVKGIVTLRAHSFLPEQFGRMISLVNSSQRPSYLLLMIQEWLNLVLNMVVMIMAVLVTTFSIQLHAKSGFAGASLYSLLTLGENLSGIVIYWTKLETSLGAIARLKTFSETVTSEDLDSEDIIPPAHWPQQGAVTLNNLSASYGRQSNGEGTPKLALCNISINITSGEKVAICGRTGSGKSSLIALLLKLVDPLPETPADHVLIDGTPLCRLDRAALRQRIIAVPQEAVFLPDGCSYKANLDPSGVSIPSECEEVLKVVGLWGFVLKRGGLDAGMSAGTMSAGQKQLLSLSRALLRQRVRVRHSMQGGMLLLDEVSSSVDAETERSMQEIIRNEFQEYTVVSVSHRLDMIMDFDRIFVMDAGKIVETGNPVELAEIAGTRFGDLLRAARSAE